MYNNILLTVDPNEEASWKTALPTAVDLSKHTGARLCVVGWRTLAARFASLHNPSLVCSSLDQANWALLRFAGDDIRL